MMRVGKRAEKQGCLERLVMLLSIRPWESWKNMLPWGEDAGVFTERPPFMG